MVMCSRTFCKTESYLKLPRLEIDGRQVGHFGCWEKAKERAVWVTKDLPWRLSWYDDAIVNRDI